MAARRSTAAAHSEVAGVVRASAILRTAPLTWGDFLRFQDGDGAARGVGCLVGGFVMRVQVAVLSAGSSARARAAD